MKKDVLVVPTIPLKVLYGKLQSNPVDQECISRRTMYVVFCEEKIFFHLYLSIFLL